jgi:hypothetical protein
VSALPGAHEFEVARVQELTRQYDTDIILTEHVREQLDPRFSLHDLPPTQV